LNISEKSANIYVSVYWGSMFVGRILGAVLLKYVSAAKVLLSVALLAIALTAISLFGEGIISAYSMVAVGFCNSIMFAIIFSLAVQGLGNQTTQASGLLSS